MALAKTKRDAWVDEGLDVLGSNGPEAVKIESIARRLGVTKGGFYGYFRNRRQLIEAMLDKWENEATRAVVEQVSAERLDTSTSAFRAAQLTWAEGRLLDVDLAVRNWARRDADVAARLERVDTYRLDYLRSQMRRLCPDPREAEARSLLAYAAAIGMRYAGFPTDELVGQDAVDLITTPGTLNPRWSHGAG